MQERQQDWRIGYGEDAHRLAEGRTLTIAGVRVPHTHGAVAHSDGDAALHALSDALLSSLALGDIGHYFPDTDPAHSGLDSAVILKRVLELVAQKGYALHNVALVVTLDRPKLGILRTEMTKQLADLLGLEDGCVGLSFKTSEGLAPEHIQARATVLLRAL